MHICQPHRMLWALGCATQAYNSYLPWGHLSSSPLIYWWSWNELACHGHLTQGDTARWWCTGWVRAHCHHLSRCLCHSSQGCRWLLSTGCPALANAPICSFPSWSANAQLKLTSWFLSLLFKRLRKFHQIIKRLVCFLSLISFYCHLLWASCKLNFNQLVSSKMPILYNNNYNNKLLLSVAVCVTLCNVASSYEMH